MSFLAENEGFYQWQTTAETWTNRQGETWHFDINNRAVSHSNDGVVSIYPDDTGTTAWFADVLREEPDPWIGGDPWPDP